MEYSKDEEVYNYIPIFNKLLQWMLKVLGQKLCYSFYFSWILSLTLGTYWYVTKCVSKYVSYMIHRPIFTTYIYCNNKEPIWAISIKHISNTTTCFNGPNVKMRGFFRTKHNITNLQLLHTNYIYCKYVIASWMNVKYI